RTAEVLERQLLETIKVECGADLVVGKQQVLLLHGERMLEPSKDENLFRSALADQPPGVLELAKIVGGTRQDGAPCIGQIGRMLVAKPVHSHLDCSCFARASDGATRGVKRAPASLRRRPPRVLLGSHLYRRPYLRPKFSVKVTRAGERAACAPSAGARRAAGRRPRDAHVTPKWGAHVAPSVAFPFHWRRGFPHRPLTRVRLQAGCEQ